MMGWSEWSAATRRRWRQAAMATPPAVRLLQALEWTDALRVLAEAELRRRHPGASPREIQARMAARIAGTSVARRLYGLDVDGT